MRGLARCVVELAVLHASACAHALHVTGRDALDVAHAVLVGQFARQHVADDFHVAVAMGAKPGARRNAVFVDDAQVAKAHVGGVVVPGEREAVEGIEPAMVGVAPVLRFTNSQHVSAPFKTRL